MKRLIWVAVIGVLLAPATARAQTEDVVYYHTDAIGSVRMVTDDTGAVIQRYDYLPFGEAWDPPTNPDPRQFAGKERDTETGLDYFGARYYASGSGRFTTVDPLMDIERTMIDPQQWNRYAYARNNPFKYVDPDGRAIETLWDLISLGMSAKAVWQNPTSGWNWASLGADIVSVAGPGIPAIGMAIRGAGQVDDVSRAIVKYDPEFAARQILGEAPVTAGGRSITPHAADRMVHGAPGRRPMSKAEVDQVLDQGDRIRKVDMNHPQGPTVTVQNTRMPGKPQVVVDAATGKRVVTVIQPQ